MRVRRTAAQIISCFQLVRAQVRCHICTHLHCYCVFQYRDKKGFQSHTHFSLNADFFSDLECNIAEPQSFSVSRKRQASLMERGSISMEDLQEGTLPFARRKIQEVDC